MANIYGIEIETKLQERLSAPAIWKEILKVKFTNTNTLKNPYLTDSATFDGTRGTGYDSTAVATVDDSLAITDYIGSAQHIDNADLAQKTFSDFMEIADNMGKVLHEKMETKMLLQHAKWTNFDNASIGGAAGNITVAVSNIKTIIANIKEAIRTAGGQDLADRNGIFIQWREADFTLVELLASSEGFNTADNVLKNGIKKGFKYLGVENYSTSRNVAGHVFAGVKKAMVVGICKATYGKMNHIVNPVVSSKQISGIGKETRIDSIFHVWNNNGGIVFDVLVA